MNSAGHRGEGFDDTRVLTPAVLYCRPDVVHRHRIVRVHFMPVTATETNETLQSAFRKTVETGVN
jgi:hypothetical protein